MIEVLVSEGQTLKKNDPLITIESDKSSVEIPSNFDGKIKTLKIKVGDKVSEGDSILILENINEAQEKNEKKPVIEKEIKKTQTTKPETKKILTDQNKVFKFLKQKKPDLVIVAAARVGGIQANSNFKQLFIYENLQIQNNLIHGSFLAKVKNLIFLGSSCIYPKFCKQPMKESYFLSGRLEETNDAYAIAKIAGIKLSL